MGIVAAIVISSNSPASRSMHENLSHHFGIELLRISDVKGSGRGERKKAWEQGVKRGMDENRLGK